MRLESLHRIPVIKDIMPKLPMDEDYVIINESISFEPTDDYFAIGGKVFAEEDENCEVYKIYNDGNHIGMLAIEEYPNTIVLEGLEIFKEYRKQGFGKKVVDLLKKKRKRIYVRAIPSAKKFWEKQGHKAYYNKDAGTYDGDLIYESIKLVNKDYADTRLITTPQELNAYLQNNTESRVVYDVEKKWYLVGNSETSIHVNLISDAFKDGYYEPFKYKGKTVIPTNDLEGNSGKLLYEMNPTRFILFRVSSDELNGEEYYYDRYKYCYIYPNYCIFDRNQDFQKTSLYKVLGEPLDLDFIGDIDGEELDESIAYAEMNDDDMMVILHNPTRKELKDNHLDDECRIVYDGNNGYYFASSEWTHEQIEQKLQANNLPYSETSGEFYYYQDNLFTTRDDWSSEEEYQEYKNDWYQSLKSMPYIVKNFGNFKVEIFKGEYLSEEYEGLNRLAGFYWFDENKFQMLKRKPIGVKKLDPEDNEFDYYHLDDNGLEEDNKARFGIEKIGQKLVCYIEAEDKQKCLIAKKAIQRKFNDILIDKFQLSWGRNNFAELDESIAYAERSDDYYDDSEYQDMTNVILKNPSRKELIDNGMIECRIVKDYKDNFYFANSYEMIHTDIVDKLESENITSVETNLFYDVNSNTFYYNVGHLADNEIKDFSQREEQMLRTSSYVSKTFKNFKFKLTYGEM